VFVESKEKSVSTMSSLEKKAKNNLLLYAERNSRIVKEFVITVTLRVRTRA
jgi:hypothetical protein